MKSTSPDYGFWAQHAEVKLYQGVALLCGINPDTADLFFLMTDPKDGDTPDANYCLHSPEDRQAFRKLFRVATANIPPAGDLPVSPGYQPGIAEDYNAPVLLPKFITWCGFRGFPVSSELQALAQPILGPPVGWEGFDPNSSTYPKLLDIALQAWRWASKTAPEGLTPKQAILRFLAKQYPELPNATRNYIAMICNWNKVGGHPPKE